MLNQLLSTLIFLFPFVAFTILFFTKTERWRRSWINISAFAVFVAFSWYVTLLWALRKIEGVDILGHKLNPDVIPLHLFIGSAWLPVLYVLAICALGYIAFHRASRNVNRRND